MSADHPSPPDQPDLPKRHRISLEKLRQESAETHLWDIDGDEATQRPKITPEPRRMAKEEAPTNEFDPFDSPLPSSYIDDFPSLDDDPDDPFAAQPPPPRPSRQDMPKISPLISEIGELDGWDDDESHTPVLPPPAYEEHHSTPEPVSPAHEIDRTDVDPAAPAPTSSDAPPSLIEESLAPKPKSQNRRKSILSAPETAGLGLLALLLITGAAYFLITAFRDLPRIVDPYEMPSLPAKGSHLSITTAESYWRIPLTTGPDADVVQRGTALIPIIEITASGQSAVLRLQFRDSQGDPAGDPITHTVRGTKTFTIQSTAGLDDVNIHDAYRTGLIDPWTVEILEAPEGTTSGNAFLPLATFPISTDRR